MYQYNEFDRNFVNQRVAHYRDQTARYLQGDLSEDEFLQLEKLPITTAQESTTLIKCFFIIWA